MNGEKEGQVKENLRRGEAMVSDGPSETNVLKSMVPLKMLISRRRGMFRTP